MADTPTTEAARAVIQEVMARAEFHPGPDWRETLTEWLLRLLSKGPTPGSIPLPPFWLLFAILTALVLFVLYQWLPRLGVKSGRAPVPVTLCEILEGTATSRSQALVLARSALEREDVRKALWIGHRLLLADLDQSRRLQFVASKTNTHYLKECHDPLLRRFTLLYDEAVYAHRPVSAQEASELLTALS